MKSQVFWLKCVFIFALTAMSCALVTTWMVAQLYADKTNNSDLKDLGLQALSRKGEVENNLRFLINDIVLAQSEPVTTSLQHSTFSVLAVIRRSDQRIIQVIPETLSNQIKNLKKIPFEKINSFPIAFHPLKFSWREQIYLSVLVDPQQIQFSQVQSPLPKDKIFLGILTTHGILKLLKGIKGQNFESAFLMDRNKNWYNLHSTANYSGYALTSQSRFIELKKKYPNGWNLHVKEDDLLSAGIRLGVSDSFLVLNKKARIWQDYYFSLFQQIFLVIFAVSSLMFIPIYFFINPLVEVYKYLRYLISRYSIWNSFPAPEYSGRNIYIKEIQPHLQKIFWKIREERMSTSDSSKELEDDLYFSQIIQDLSEQIQNKYPGMDVNLNVEEDMVISSKSNWLKQAMLEILKNAAESSKNQSQISVHCFQKDDAFHCTVRDYGPGVDESSIHQICDAYFSSKTDRRGLGLTLAHSALSRIGGQLHFSNAEDDRGGFLVRVSLPLDLSKEQIQENADKLKLPGTRESYKLDC